MSVATFTVVHVATRRTLTSGIGQDAGVISYANAMVWGLTRRCNFVQQFMSSRQQASEVGQELDGGASGHAHHRVC
jgi:hypothetical protein